MKTLIFSLLLLASPAAWADSPLISGLPETLMCELVDLRSGRTVDQGAAAIESRETGVIFLGYGIVTGTVRDWPGEGAERTLDMKLEYNFSGGWGRAEGRHNYMTDVPATGEPVGSIQIDDPQWGRTMQMRCFALAEPAGSRSLDPVEVSTDPTLSLTSQTWYETGRGSANGYCGGSMGSFCLDQVKARAREDAARDGRWSCEFRGGRADTLFPSCFDSCSPSWIPIGSPDQWVSCSSQCQIRCEKP